MQRKWVIGLGNPGKKYESTRHNVGFRVLERLAKGLDVKIDKEKHQSLYVRTEVQGVQLTLIMPQTFMNLSGEAAAAWKRRDGLEPETELLVLYDDMDLPLGKLRFRLKGTAGSHNGMASLVELLGGTAFQRLRLGIGKPEDPALWADYVTQKFTPDEKPVLEDMLARAAQKTLAWVASESTGEKLVSEMNR
ncbi:MAG: aminoacyl-tRNA hydrolase [candidate division FCPU426 bacterium]